MPDAHAALGIELDDGTLAARAIVLPDGSVAALSNLDSGCCCGNEPGQGCFLKLMPCFCSDPSRVRYIQHDPLIEATWPREDRQAGKTIVVAGTCWNFYGSRRGPIPAPLILGTNQPGDLTVYDNCYVSPCSGQTPCPPCSGGFGFVRQPPLFFDDDSNEYLPCPASAPYAGIPIMCVAEMRVFISASGSSSASGGGSSSVSSSISYSGYYRLVRGIGVAWRLADYEVTFHAAGSDLGGSWDETVVINNANPNPNGAPFSFSILLTPRFSEENNEGVAMWGGSPDVGDTAINFFSPYGENPPCQGTVSGTVQPNGTTYTHTRASSFGTSGSSIAGSSSVVLPSGRRLESSGRRSTFYQITHSGDEPINPDDACDFDPRLAVACDPDTTPSTITYDALLAGPGDVTLLVGENRYALTSTLSNDTPVSGEFSSQPCPTAGGGGGPVDAGDPSDTGTTAATAPRDPRIDAEIERQRQLATGQFPGRCPSCGG